MIRLGDIARDKVTGYEGMVVAITEWLHGCKRIGIQPTKLDKDGKPRDAMQFDELQVELVKAGKHTPVQATGGPRPNLARR